MIISLILKDFRLLKSNESRRIYRILMLLIKVIFLVCEIALLCYLVRILDNKINEYSPNYGSIDFFTLLLFLIFLFNTVQGLIKVRKSLYESNDNYILNTLPLEDDKIIISKMFQSYFSIAINTLFLTMPIMITYGLNRVMPALYYVFTFFYPFCTSVVSIGFIFLFVSLYEFIYRFLKNKEIVQFILASILMIGLCYLYKIFLELFFICLEDSSIGNVFSSNFIDTINVVSRYLFPISNLIIPIFKGENVLGYMVVLVGFALLFVFFGYLLATYFYSRFKTIDSISFNSKDKRKEKVRSLNASLLKKELCLIFRDSSSIFSYTSLLIMLPFLCYVVSNALVSIIFSNFTTFAILYPYLDDVLLYSLVLLFISCISSSQSLIEKEKNNIVTLKTLPISPIKMILIKFIVPFSLSFISLFATLLTLYITNLISIELFIFTLISGIIYLVCFNILGLIAKMYDLGERKTKIDNIYYTFSLFFPILLLIINFIFVFLRLENLYIYITNGAIYLILILYTFLFFKKRVSNTFYMMEVSN